MSRPTASIDPQSWVRLAQDVRSKQRGLAIAFTFYSPKNQELVTVWGQSAFCHLILSEGNHRIRSYLALRKHECKSRVLRQTADVSFNDGHQETWIFASDISSGRIPSIDNTPPSAIWKTVTELRGKEILISNWINLRACMDRIRGLSTLPERQAIERRLSEGRRATLKELVFATGVDFGTMLGVVGFELAARTLCADLDTQYFNLQSQVWRA